jgi:hypothetical protein
MINKKNLFVTIIFLLAIPLQNFTFAQSSFEGKIKLLVSEEGSKNTIEYMAKGDKIRLEIADADEVGTMIFDAKNKSMMIIMPAQKMYMEMVFDLTGADSYFEDDSPSGKITRTGEKKIIKGYECEKWIAEDEGYRTESWLTDKLGGFMFFGNPMEAAGSDWKSKLSTPNLFPMLVNVYESGKLVNSIEVIDIKQQKLDNSLFSAPSGYQKFDMPSFNMQKHK